MKYLKRAFYLILILAVVTGVGSCALQKMEDYQSSYLKIKNKSSLSINSYLIQNINVVSMTADTVLTNKMILVEDGVIKTIGDDIPNSGEKLIDGQGGYITPGLIDMHVHVWDKFELGLYLANGVTTVRNMLGMPFHLKLKKELNSNKILGPILYTASPQFTGIKDKSIEKRSIKTPEEAKKLVIKYKEKGYDYIKTYNMLPKDIFNATLEQGIASGIPIVAHPSYEVSYDYHFNSAISTIEHTEDIVQQPLDFVLDSTKLQPIIDGYINSKQSHCPTLIVYYNLTEIYNKEDEVLTTEQAGFINPFLKKIYMAITIIIWVKSQVTLWQQSV